MVDRVSRKRMVRNLTSRRKRWLRRRGMSGQMRSTLHRWQRKIIRRSDHPLRGVRAEVGDGIVSAPKRGFLTRFFRWVLGRA